MSLIEEAARVRVRCFWAKFKDLSPILTTGGASYIHKKGNIYRACVQSVNIYGAETWAMKAENLHNLERAEHRKVGIMMVRWICGVSLKDRRSSVDLYSLLGIQSVVRHGGLR